MAILSKGCKPDNFESHNTLKLRFININIFAPTLLKWIFPWIKLSWCYCSTWDKLGWKIFLTTWYFLESYSPETFAEIFCLSILLDIFYFFLSLEELQNKHPIKIRHQALAWHMGDSLHPHCQPCKSRKRRLRPVQDEKPRMKTLPKGKIAWADIARAKF